MQKAHRCKRCLRSGSVSDEEFMNEMVFLKVSTQNLKLRIKVEHEISIFHDATEYEYL